MTWIFFGLLLYSLVVFGERALVALSARDLEQLRNARGGRSARQVLALTENPRSALAALLLARVLLKVSVSVAVVVMIWRYQTIFSTWPGGYWLAGAFAALLLAAIFAGIEKIGFPRFVRERHVFWLRRGVWFIRFWQILFAVFVREKQPAETPANEKPAQRGSELSDATGEKRDIELLKSIVKFSDVTVKQVMQARSKVVAVDFRMDFDALLDTVREAGFSRLPVCDGDLDNVTGILYVKDLVPHLDEGAGFEWQSLIRTDVLLVPEAKRVSELLQDFKKKKLHLAVVVDEYGGSAGIVTMEDVLEEVTGEIRDEFDEESEVRYRKLDDFNYAFEGQALLNDVCRISGLSPDTFDDVRGAADTLAGLALELRGDIPTPGAEIAWNGFVLTVTAADSRRIEQLKLTLPRE